MQEMSQVAHWRFFVNGAVSHRVICIQRHYLGSLIFSWFLANKEIDESHSCVCPEKSLTQQWWRHLAAISTLPGIHLVMQRVSWYWSESQNKTNCSFTFILLCVCVADKNQRTAYKEVLLILCSFCTEKGQVYKQKKPTMYPPWSSTFDAHIHRGRIMHVMVKDRTAELKSEATVALDSLATRCKKENGKLEIWVSIVCVCLHSHSSCLAVLAKLRWVDSH